MAPPRPPPEIRNRVLWDAKYAKEHPDYFDSSSSDDSYDDSEYAYPNELYVSGDGVQPPEPVTIVKQIRALAGQASSSKPHNLKHKNVSHGGQTIKGRLQKSRRPRRMDLNFDKDNAAKAAFRKHGKPATEFVLPRNCNEIEPNRTKMCDYFEEIGIRLGSFIRPPQQVSDRKIHLWGGEDQIRRTKAELHEWVQRSSVTVVTNTKSDKFSKVLSVDGHLYWKLQKKIKQEANLRRFQQEPAKGITFSCGGSFLWPKDEISPTDLLGANLEALDPIRIQYRCHVLFDAQRSIIEVLTNDIEAVKKALLRFRGVIKEYVARSRRPIVRHYIEPPKFSAFRKEIAIGDPNSSSLIPLLTGEKVEAESQNSWLRRFADLQASSARGLEDILRVTIPNLSFHRGQVRMRVHFGTFALTMFPWSEGKGSVSFDDFMKRLALPGVKGMMIKDLYIRKSPIAIVDKIYKASELLQPLDNYTNSIADVSPSFNACFEIVEDEKATIKLEVEMSSNPTEPNLYEKTSTLWSRPLPRSNPAPLSVFLVRIDGGPSWKLQASNENLIDMTRISPQFIAFKNSIKLKKPADARVELTGEKIFHWNNIPGSLRVISFQQKTALRYRLVRNMDYTIEIARYDTYQHPETKPKGTCWAASLWSTEWDSQLIANSNLGIGEAADWDARIGTFFPDRDNAPATGSGVSDGVSEFLKIARDVADFLDDVKREAPHMRG